jgi:DNA anti-recombination protein RmuC
MYDQIIKSINILEDSEKNLMKAVDNVSSAKKFIKDGRGSLYNKAEEMKNLGLIVKRN